jgi:hypothetical protein
MAGRKFIYGKFLTFASGVHKGAKIIILGKLLRLEPAEGRFNPQSFFEGGWGFCSQKFPPRN